MAERSAEVDQMKGATLEQISSMVEEIGREFKSKKAQLNPLMAELKVIIIIIIIFICFMCLLISSLIIHQVLSDV